jgi:predicted aldo/keto reductase-like oxidoreductase
MMALYRMGRLILRVTPRIGLLGALALTFCTGFSAAQAPPASAAGDERPQVRHYNVLGRTGLRVSDISFGAGNVSDPALIEYALDRGINYFDTAESYGRQRSESAIGQVAARRRGEMVICTKFEMNEQTTVEEMFTRLDACLGRLQTNYVDVLMVHGGSSEALHNEAVFAAFDSLKQAGKIHFCGVSHHGPNISGELMPLIEANKIDVILCSYDPVGDPGLPAMLAAAREKGIGLVAMKVITSAQKAELPEFTSGRYPFHIAALRWGLQTSGMHCLIPSMNMMDQVDEYLLASGAANE